MILNRNRGYYRAISVFVKFIKKPRSVWHSVAALTFIGNFRLNLLHL